MACTACQKARRRKSIGAMKNKKGMTNALVEVLAGTAGLLGAQMLNKVAFIGANPLIGGAVKIGVGLMAAGATKGAIQKAAMGVALGGGLDLAGNFISPSVTGIGYLRPGSTSVNTIAGYGPIVD